MADVEIRELEEQRTAVMRGSVDRRELASWLAAAHGTLSAHLQTIGVAVTGAPFARYGARDAEVLEVEAGLPVAETVTSRDQVEAALLPGGPAVVAWHRGSLDDVDGAYELIERWAARTGAELVDRPWEVLDPDPEGSSADATWIIEVVQPYRTP